MRRRDVARVLAGIASLRRALLALETALYLRDRPPVKSASFDDINRVAKRTFDREALERAISLRRPHPWSPWT